VKVQNEVHWCQKHLADQTLFQLLEKIDHDFAAQTHQGGCWFCGAPLYRGDYERKPRGGPQWDVRYSFCCSREGCRRRCTPASVRFLGRRVYAGFVVVLLSAMLHGVSAQRVQCLRKVLQMDRRTLLRWREWWLETFVQTRFWRAARALFMPPLCEQTLPWSLAKHYGAEQRDRFMELMKFLAPLTVPGAPDAQVR
jgi:hypothetical protein